MLLQDMIDSIRIELGDKTKAIWEDDDDIIRAIHKSVALMSRLTPKKDLVEDAIESDWITGTRLLDISETLPDYIRIESVEYPADDEPPTIVTFDVYGNYLVFRSDPSLTADETIRIYYLCKWTPPTPTAEGDYPTSLDDVVIIGSCGEALIFKAEYYVNLAANAQEEVDTLLTSLSGLSLSLDTLTPPTAPTLSLPTAPTNYSFSKPTAPTLPDAPTAPSAPDISGYITDIETALSAAITQFEAAVTTLESMDTPLGNAATQAGCVATQIGHGQDYLEDGDGLINVATRGENVGDVYGKYAGYEADLAKEYAEAAGKYVDIALAWEANAARDTTIGNGYLNDAIQVVTTISRILDKYEGELKSYSSDVAQYSVEVSGVIDKYKGEIAGEEAGIANFNAQISKFGDEITNERIKVEKFYQEVALYGQQIADQQNQINEFRSSAETLKMAIDGYNAQATQYLELAGRYLASGQAKINEMLIALGFKPEFQTQKASANQTPF